jgi:nucleotide-binding universal stress UspA family protein
MAHRKILLGLDGSRGSFKALAEAMGLAKALGAELHTVSVEEVPHYPGTVGEVVEAKEAANGKFGKALETAEEMAEQQDVPIRWHVLVGHEVKTIVEFVTEKGFDLLVVGFMGHSALYDRVMGSTCQSLVRLAPCSVLVVK